MLNWKCENPPPLHEGYITLKVSLIHHYILDFFEFWNDGVITDYRYHVRDKDDKLLVRWDNAKHHKDVETYPHHQHLKDKILASNRPELSEMLNLITQYW